MPQEKSASADGRMRHFLTELTAELRQAKKRISAYEAEENEPVAIVGMGCRLPGGASNPAELWELVAGGTDAIGAFPTDRGWDTERLHDPLGEQPGTTRVLEGGFVYNASAFDAGFFGISPREAVGMDPQQRLLLETTWEALEDAGILPADLRGSRTSVHVGAGTQGYGWNMYADDRDTDAEDHSIIGVTTSLVSGRIAYTLGLEGAALTIDTACSSSLVALHLACQSLRRGECDLSLAGGVTVMAAPSVFVEFTKQGGLAADGRCKSFSDDADGTGWAEGSGVLVLERLSDARRNGHQVLAVIRGSAVNQDGASNGLTAPNGPSQQRVILDALAAARLAPRDIDAVEAHGTGTTLGDPIEAQALLATYGLDRDPATPLWLGSLKSNIGHSQSASGVLGVIKTVQAMRHTTLPQTLHAATPTTAVDWSAGAVQLLTESRPWQSEGRPRRAGVSSFGISGTNAHVILEEAEAEAEPEVRGAAPEGPVPLLLSGRSEQAVRDQAEALRAHLLRRPADEPSEVARSLATTRTVFAHRAVVVGETREALLDALPSVTPVLSGPGRVAGLFSGQGAQRPGMGRELAGRFPVFAAVLDEVCAVADPLLGRSLREVMWSEPAEMLERTEYAQPALFAFEVAMARLWQSWGVEFSVLAGHSVGEIAAACVAGVLSLPDAARMAVARGRLMQALPEGGAMVAIAASEVEVELLTSGEPSATIAAVNGPEAVVVSGAEEAVLRIADYWREQGRRTTRLRVSHAFHSPLMDPMLDDFATVLGELTFHEPTLPVSPSADSSQPFASTAYWLDHARHAVRFADAIHEMPSADLFLELGPDAALTPLLGAERPALATARRDTPEVLTVLQAAGTAHTHGVTVDWPALLGAGRRVPLPTYPFQRQTYWLGGTASPTAPDGARPAARNSQEERFWAAVEQEDEQTLTGLGAPAELGPALPALARWHRAARWQSTLDSWRYRIVWQPVTEPRTVAQVPGTWLVVVRSGDDSEESAAALRVLARILADTVLVETGTDRGEAKAALVDAVADAPMLAGVVSLIQHPDALLTLLQALGDAGTGARLWCLTQGGVATSDNEAPRSAHAGACWGLGLVAALEHPDRWGGLLDLPARLGEHTAGRLAGILAGDAHEDQVALRDSGVLLRRLVPAPALPAARAWNPSGTVLITGGTGSLGAHVARWLAERGTCSFVLLSRSGPDAPGAAELVEELEKAGSRVRVVAADVADRARMSSLAAELAAGGEPVRAVFHAAGVGQNTALMDMRLEEFRTVYSAKITGATVLDEVFGDAQTGLFVLFSSVSGVWGSGRYAGYAAGNAYLDALARMRRARGLAATSVAWGVWADSRMVTPEAEQHYRRRGLIPVPASGAIASLERVLDADEPTAVVADMDWDLFMTGYGAARRRPLLEELPQVRARRPQEATTTATDRGDLRGRLAGLSPAERGPVLDDMVRATLTEVLGHTDPSAIALDQPLVELGFDSLSAVQVRNKLGLATGLSLPAMLVFDHPTVTAVRDFLAAELDGAGRTAGTTGGEHEDLAFGADESFAAIYRKVALRGRMEEVEDLLGSASGLRARFSDAAEAPGGTRFVRLATGGQGPAVISFPPFAPVEQTLQFVRLASFFRDRRDLSMVTVPGFLKGEPLAESVEVLIDVLAESARQCAAGSPFALLGYSSSGWLAHCVAARMEALGTPAQGLVLLDTYLPDGMSVALRQAMTYEVNERRSRFTKLNFTSITALGTYRRMFRGWSPQPLSTPTLFVRPEECIPGDPGLPPLTAQWRTHWPLPHTDATVPGDHCTIVAENADATAALVHDWLDTL
ncbi:type I polyketide synthase [Streptomyces kronopolitis]|uniref:type I polyketide synthase n=1 Tax=Streptomyces kronopolitis TaxID=1612435 RepID=UPI003D95A9EA